MAFDLKNGSNAFGMESRRSFFSSVRWCADSGLCAGAPGKGPAPCGVSRRGWCSHAVLKPIRDDIECATGTVHNLLLNRQALFGATSEQDGRFGSGDGDREAWMTRQMPFEPLPASVLFALGSCLCYGFRWSRTCLRNSESGTDFVAKSFSGR